MFAALIAATAALDARLTTAVATLAGGAMAWSAVSYGLRLWRHPESSAAGSPSPR